MIAVSGIILAGGRSSRMGQDKTFLKINGRTLFETVLFTLQAVVDDIIIASNQRNKYGVTGVQEVADQYAGKGPLGGIHAGLLAAKHEHSLVISADMPFVTAPLLRYLLLCQNSYDSVVPLVGGRREPLCAVYSKGCLSSIEACLEQDQRKVQALYDRISVREVTAAELEPFGDWHKLFFNMNTPEDYRNAKKCSQFLGPEGSKNHGGSDTSYIDCGGIGYRQDYFAGTGRS